MIAETGWIAIISIAINCSPAFIRPISAVNEVPARPANSSAVTTGPSSRVSEGNQQSERFLSAITIQSVIALQAEYETDEQAGHRNNQQRLIPNKVNLPDQPPWTFENAGNFQHKPQEKARAVTGAAQAAQNGAPCSAEEIE